tara:strand:+ start:2050 stop:2553 length:504 start_codon:yes stop_codon:yes gene_type:complete
MSIVQLIQNQSTKVIQRGGMHWRIKRVRSKDCLRAGLATMIHLAPEDLGELDPENEEHVQKVAGSWSSKMAAMTDVQAAKLSDSLDALVCAGIVAVSQDGVDFEDIKFTLNEREVNIDKSILSVDSLPWTLRQELASDVQIHSREGMEDAEQAVATFRKRAEPGVAG